MKIKWLAHASFLITSSENIRILTDPYHAEQGISHAPIKESAEIVTVSHDHFDHNAFSAVAGSPVKVASPGTTEAKGIQFKGIPVYHDENQGKQRGKNIIFCFTVDNIRICHLGDLGHLLSSGQVKEIGAVDILLIPVGGFFTIDAAAAGQVCEILAPRIAIPMHYKNSKLDFPVAGVEPFIKGKDNVILKEASEVEYNTATLPVQSEIIVLKPAY